MRQLLNVLGVPQEFWDGLLLMSLVLGGLLIGTFGLLQFFENRRKRGAIQLELNRPHPVRQSRSLFSVRVPPDSTELVVTVNKAPAELQLFVDEFGPDTAKAKYRATAAESVRVKDPLRGEWWIVVVCPIESTAEILVTVQPLA